jgi:1,2-diacylglycerol 3-alpha-glucosyltransferase
VHIVFFGDQHPRSLGGAQVSMHLQRTFLERAGHTVTMVSPTSHKPDPAEGPGDRAADEVDAASVDLPSWPIMDREYSFSWPGRAIDRSVEARIRDRPAADLVHVQADFWGACIGYRYARRHGLPVVHTMHNRVDVGMAAISRFPQLALVGMNLAQRIALRPTSAATTPRGADAWAYLRGLAAHASAVTAPSTHFARRLEEHGVFSDVDVVWNGIDDGMADALEPARRDRMAGRPRLVWLGRMSPEKRLLPFIEALAVSGVEADVDVLGAGTELETAKRMVERLRPAASVSFRGRVPYVESLRTVALADAVVQTSLGFETQGMTVFEAASLGVPSVISDPDIARELGRGFWAVGGARDVPPAVPEPSVTALAETLRHAVAEIGRADTPHPDPAIARTFRQSSRTAAMIAVYRRVLAG